MKSSISYLKKNRWIILYGSMLLIVLIVAIFLAGIKQEERSQAAGSVFFDIEDGTITGDATIQTDVDASNGSYVQFGSLLATGGTTPTPLPTSKYTLVWSDEFDGTSLNSVNWTLRTGTESHSQSTYQTGNVSVSNGIATIKTQRHCVSSDADALTSSNATTAPCVSGQITKYSSGYLVSKTRWQPQGRIEIRAKLPATYDGLWPALWLRNQIGWCNTNYGEFDIMEWYADQPNYTTATSHITCSSNTTKKSQHFYDAKSDLSSGWHTWAIEWDTTKVIYEMDGIIITASGRTFDTIADFSGVSTTTWDAVLNQTWELRINTQVIKNGVGASPWHPAADPLTSFPAAFYQIDYVRVYN